MIKNQLKDWRIWPADRSDRDATYRIGQEYVDAFYPVKSIGSSYNPKTNFAIEGVIFNSENYKDGEHIRIGTIAHLEKVSVEKDFYTIIVTNKLGKRYTLLSSDMHSSVRSMIKHFIKSAVYKEEG